MTKDTAIKIAAIAFYGMCIATVVSFIFDLAPKFLVSLVLGAMGAHSYGEIKKWCRYK